MVCGQIIHASGGIRYPFAELAATKPLLLASLLVQEDLLLLRRSGDDEEYVIHAHTCTVPHVRACTHTHSP